MNVIDKYQEAKSKLARFEQWAGKYGKEYFGGTRGNGGHYGSIVGAEGSLTIYYQEYNGANNYHDLDREFSLQLKTAMILHGNDLIISMRKQLTDDLEKYRVEAEKLVAEIKL